MSLQLQYTGGRAGRSREEMEIGKHQRAIVEVLEERFGC